MLSQNYRKEVEGKMEREKQRKKEEINIKQPKFKKHTLFSPQRAI